MAKLIMMFMPLFILASALCASPAHCLDGENARQVRTADGNIVDVDWVGQKIVVRWLQTQGQVRFDELTFFVPDGTRITRGTDTISLSDLNMTDPVSVEYYNASPGPLTAVSIKVKL